MNSKRKKGIITELECELAFSRLGFTVLKPICEDCRYDYVVDIGNKFIRIQCKTCRIEENKTALKFSATSTQVKANNYVTKLYTKEEIDYFYTCYNHISYLIPVEDNMQIYVLRIKPSLTSNQFNAKRAEDFELQKALLKYEAVESFLVEENSYYSNKRSRKKCKKCGNPIGYKATYCINCYKENRELKSKLKAINRKNFKADIRQNSFCQVAKKYNTSDRTVRNWCAKLNLPSTKKEIDSYSDEEWEKI